MQKTSRKTLLKNVPCSKVRLIDMTIGKLWQLAARGSSIFSDRQPLNCKKGLL